MREDPFWIVFCPTGPSAPTCMHASIEGAKTEAQRLARLHKGARFFVMGSRGGYVASDLVTIACSSGGPGSDDDIPF